MLSCCLNTEWATMELDKIMKDQCVLSATASDRMKSSNPTYLCRYVSKSEGVLTLEAK
jgi:hypothetical protein